MRLRFLLSIVLLLSVSFAFAQNQTTLEFANQKLEERGEFFFHFTCEDTEILQELNQLLWIDKVEGSTIYAYATPATFPQFLTYGIKFSPVESYYDQSKALTMATTTAQMASWDRYPTHAVYLQMLDDFVTNYPDLCQVEIIGYSEEGLPIKTLIISDNIGTDEDEPEFWWSGTMHGDETLGYVLLLRMADYLLSNYGTDAQVTNLVNEIEIYINPLANPDGTFNGSSGLDDVSGSSRANANGIDLNRNFPTVNGDSYTLQTEITSMMDYATNHDFVMSVNTHGGIELINYPWDAWQSWENIHPDNDWWVHVGFVYADQIEIDAPATYFEGPGSMDYGSYNDSGVTHGADWYYAIGSRQDYMNYYQNCREITLEISDTKTLGTEYLNTYWDYNEQAMLDYTEQVLYGLRGVVTDACTGSPLTDVKVEIVGHDQDNTEVYSSAPVGNYHRPIYDGTYDFTFTLAGYQTQTHTVTIANDNSVRLDIEMIPDNVGAPDFTADQTSVFEGTTVSFTDQSTGTITAYNWILSGATPNSSTDANPSADYNTAGTYDVNLEITSEGCTVNELKENYITVSAPTAPTADFTASATNVSVGSTVDFTDLSSGNPASWSWTFDGGTPNAETAQNPSITYNTVGTYDVSLTATNAYGSDAETKTTYITVIEPDIIMQNGSVTQCGGSFYDAGGTSDYTNDENYELTIYPSTPGAFVEVEFTSFDVEPNGADCYDYLTIYDGENSSATEIGAYCGTDPTVIGTNGVVTASTATGALTFVFYSDGGVTEPGWVANVSCYSPTDPPVATFSAAETSTCTGEIQFQDESALATGWSWDFGDGNTSNEQHPLHTYTADGTYTVSLTVTNDYGTDNTSITDYITVDMPDAPVIADAENCGAGSVTLSATAAGEINWYDAQTGGNFVATGSDYTNNFTATTILYADNTLINSQSFSAGKVDNTGDGGFFTNANQHGLIFDAYTEFVIESVTVYADGAGDRTISLLDNTDTEIASTTLAVPDGESVVTLNFTVPAGTNYTLMGPESPNLYRNGGGGTILPFPYELTDILSIHDNTAGNLEYYYYFYDWQVRIDETCVSSRTAATVTIHDIPTVDLGDDIDICDGDDFTFDAGAGFSVYTWNPSGADQTYVATTTGNYTVTVEDANGCTATDNVNLIVNPNPELSFTSTPATGTNSDGSITVNVISGDELPLTYNWNTFPEQSTQTASDLPAGNYCVTVANDFGCATVGCDEISSENLAPVADFSADITEACGNLTVQFTDLSTENPTSWEWDFGDGNTSTDQSPQHVYTNPGTYTVSLIVTNVGGSDTQSMTDYIHVYDQLVVSNGTGNVTCYGDSDGSLSAIVSGGEGTYTYVWENESGTEIGSTATLDNLTGGMYYLTVTDLAGCSDNGTYTVYEADQAMQVNLVATNESVAGACDGTVVANVTGGVSPYLFIWDNGIGVDDATIENLCAGNYQVTVTDDYGCTVIESVEVLSGPQPPIADFSADITSACGFLTVQFSDQSSNTPTTWDWDFGNGTLSSEQNPQITYTSPGTYSVTLTVANAQGSDVETKIDFITIYDNIEITGADSELACYGDMNGELSVLVNGGSGVYSYFWENESGTSVGNTADITGLVAGTYSLSVTDDIGCMAMESFVVSQPEPLSLNFDVTNESALSLCDGEITPTANGGTIPYNYQWQTLPTQPVQSGLCPGTYYLTLTDANGCSISGNAEVIEGPEVLAANFSADITEGCENLTVQFTDLSVGTPTAWTWNFGDGESSDLQTPEHTYTEPGVYTVSLLVEDDESTTDEQIFTDYVTVLDRPELDFEVTHESAPLAGDGEITVLITGTDFPYEFDWNTGGDTETIIGLTAGVYSVAVTGANGCAATEAAQVQTLTALLDNQTQQTILFPNPVKRDLFVEAAEQVTSLQVLSIDGRVVMESNPENSAFSLEMPATSGMYMLVLNYKSGMSERFPVVVE
ncbi:MAG: PKD domain-containing protein [Bacteroidales bacterium]|jgi:PKD repeat protein|nr:PKD domain-containing protein [Bacteroidales bacterium]